MAEEGRGNKQRCVVVMYDTLCRHFMPTYGNEWIIAPNFQRLAKKSVQMQNMYVGSLPCMPARREMHTGRHNFLHRSWGPLEPFDDSMPELLHVNGVHSHKSTDHQHYWEDGGATYHSRFKTFDFVRGQEGDWWKGDVEKLRDVNYGAERWSENQRAGAKSRQDNINREFQPTSNDLPQHHTFSLGLEFIERNVKADKWMCQIETFDPHEPFFSHKEYQDLYPHEYTGPDFDWPPYREVREDDQTVQHIRYMYAALVTFCDAQLGRVLDVFDKHNLWDDTMLIVNTDHGFLMGEHDWWAKMVTPMFQEIAHVPFWIYDPRHPHLGGVRRDALATTIDIAPTVLGFFGVPLPVDMQGKPLEGRMVSAEACVRDGTIYGVFGGQVNVTDGRYVYMRAAATVDNKPLNEYTLMPTHMMSRFSPSELKDWEKHDGWGFTKECKIMQIPGRTAPYFIRDDNAIGKGRMATLLFDVINDPGQTKPILDTKVETRMIRLMVQQMDENDCPPEQYIRLGLPMLKDATPEALAKACVVGSAKGEEYAAHNGVGLPKGHFAKNTHFPNNLRLRAGYHFSQTEGPPKPVAVSKM